MFEIDSANEQPIPFPSVLFWVSGNATSGGNGNAYYNLLLAVVVFFYICIIIDTNRTINLLLTGFW